MTRHEATLVLAQFKAGQADPAQVLALLTEHGTLCREADLVLIAYDYVEAAGPVSALLQPALLALKLLCAHYGFENVDDPQWPAVD